MIRWPIAACLLASLLATLGAGCLSRDLVALDFACERSGACDAAVTAAQDALPAIDARAPADTGPASDTGPLLDATADSGPSRDATAADAVTSDAEPPDIGTPCGGEGLRCCNSTCESNLACTSLDQCVSNVGCSDGARDGFANRTTFAAIAGCFAGWPASSLRAATTGAACGNDTQVRCAVAADACARGWHICGTPPHGPTDITAKITSGQCRAETGRFAAAMGDQQCDPCSAVDVGFGAVCCGDGCLLQGGDCLWPNDTAWFGSLDGHTNLCGDTENNYPDFAGVLCCLD